MQWSFSNKVSAVPQLLSFKPPLGPDTTTIQRNCSQSGSQYTMRVYNPQELSALSSQGTMAVASGASVFQSSGVGVPSMMRSPIVGSTDLMNARNPTTLPTQLTIFYGGSVNVYEDISPETAKAIMLLAGNGSSHKKKVNTQITTSGNGPSASHNAQIPAAAIEVAAPRPTVADGFVRSWSFSGIQRPIPMSATTNAISIVNQASSSNHQQRSEPPKVVPSVAPPTTTAISTAVPQARKASLARFLEKRKERVISTSPYNLSKRFSDYGAPESGTDGRSISISSGSTSPLSAN